jgi:LPS sulfotransferase NodH
MTKFILLGHARSGSTLLICSLSQHPNIHLFGELFNTVEDERHRSFRSGLRFPQSARAPGDDVTVNETDFYRYGDDGAEFLRRHVFYEHAHAPLAVGFKLFYQQARTTSGARRVWHYLRAHPEVRVVHLLRRNLLESLLSLRIALATDEWARPRGQQTPPAPAPRLHLSPAECAGYFARIERQRESARRRFKAHPVLEVEYERDLCGRFGETVREVESFLGVPVGGESAAAPQLEKQGRGALSERISNYGELQSHFRHSPYAHLFA